MAQLLPVNPGSPTDPAMMYTPFEPKVQNRFIVLAGGIPAYLIKKVARPNIDCGEVILDHINLQRKLKGKCKWQDMTMTMYDPIVPSGAQTIMEWVRTAHETMTGRDGYAEFYKRNLQIQALGPVGDIIEQWTLMGAYVKATNFGQFDWATETAVEIEVTLGLDRAVLDY